MAREKYSIRWKMMNRFSLRWMGVYESLDRIPDEADREKLTTMMGASLEQPFEICWNKNDPQSV